MLTYSVPQASLSLQSYFPSFCSPFLVLPPLSPSRADLSISPVSLFVFFFPAGDRDRLMFGLCEARVSSVWVFLPLPPVDSSYTVFRRA